MRFLELPRSRRVPLGTRTLLRDWLRLVISVGGIGLAILLVLLLDGIREGTVAKSTTYIDHVGADVVVARQGVTNMALAASAVPPEVVGEIQAIAGVRDAAGIMRIPVILGANDEKRPATLIGYDLEGSIGGPWLLTSGRGVQDDGEAVVDDTLADELGLDLGEAVEIGGEPFDVVGLSGETANIAGKHVFITRASVQRLLGLGERISFVLVRVEPGADADAVAEAINAQLPEVTATPRDELSANDRELLSRLFVAPINVMFTVGLLVGLAVIGLTMYTTTAERIRDFGVLKAIGARNTFLFRTVMTQGLILAIAGFLAGLGAAKIAGPILVALVPDVGVTILPVTAVQTLGEVIGMSLLGAVAPVVRIMRVDPMMVFRS
jgi:putative ABC transport system permease protein